LLWAFSKGGGGGDYDSGSGLEGSDFFFNNDDDHQAAVSRSDRRSHPQSVPFALLSRALDQPLMTISQAEEEEEEEDEEEHVVVLFDHQLACAVMQALVVVDNTPVFTYSSHSSSAGDEEEEEEEKEALFSSSTSSQNHHRHHEDHHHHKDQGKVDALCLFRLILEHDNEISAATSKNEVDVVVNDATSPSSPPASSIAVDIDDGDDASTKVATLTEILDCLPPLKASPSVSALAPAIIKALTPRVGYGSSGGGGFRDTRRKEGLRGGGVASSSSSSSSSLLPWNIAVDAAAGVADAGTCLAILAHLEASQQQQQQTSQPAPQLPSRSSGVVGVLPPAHPPDAFTFGRTITACCARASSFSYSSYQIPASSSSSSSSASSVSAAFYVSLQKHEQVHQLLVAATDVACRMLDAGIDPSPAVYDDDDYDDDGEDDFNNQDHNCYEDKSKSKSKRSSNNRRRRRSDADDEHGRALEDSLSEIRWTANRKRSQLGEKRHRDLLEALETIQTEYNLLCGVVK
jgi:hypothetical protein